MKKKKSKPHWGKLEDRVARQLRRLGYRVKQQYVLRHGPKKGNLSMIDVFGRRWFFLKLYIECKNYQNKEVPFAQVAKFTEILRQCGISPAQGILVYGQRGVARRSHETGVRIMSYSNFCRMIQRRLFVRRLVWLSIIVLILIYRNDIYNYLLPFVKPYFS